MTPEIGRGQGGERPVVDVMAGRAKRDVVIGPNGIGTRVAPPEKLTWDLMSECPSLGGSATGRTCEVGGRTTGLANPIVCSGVGGSLRCHAIRLSRSLR